MIRWHIQFLHDAGDIFHQILWGGHNDRLDPRIGHRRNLYRLLNALLRAISAATAAKRRPGSTSEGEGCQAIGTVGTGNTLPNSSATSAGLAYFNGKHTDFRLSASALLSTASMILTKCRMLACASVTTIVLPASLATTDACGETNNDKSETSCRASTNRTGMIQVAISSVFGISLGSSPILTERLRVLAFIFGHNCQSPIIANGSVTVFRSTRY